MLAHRINLKDNPYVPPPVYAATLNDFSVTSSNAAPTESLAGVYLGADGNAYAYTEDGNVFQYQWLTGDGDAGDYAAYLDLTLGNLGSGSDPDNTWVNLGTGAIWFSQRTTAGTTNSTFALKIRDVHTLNELDSCTISTTVTVT